MAAGRRRRGTELEEAILAAAAHELEAVGYTRLTMDAVARRAGTNKNAIYRRWPQRAALGVAAYARLASAWTPAPGTGSLRDDALALLRQADATWSSPRGALLRDLLAAVSDDPDLLTLLREHAGGSAVDDAWRAAVVAAIARGEAPPEALHPRVTSVPLMLLRAEYAVRGVGGVPDGLLVEIVDEVFLPLVRGRSGENLAGTG